jgi:hypothetical protein
MRICISITVFLMLAANSFAQTDITLRFVDAGSGKPIKGISASALACENKECLQKPEPSGVLHIDRNDQEIEINKNGEGISHFYSEPSLKLLDVTTVRDLRGCSANLFSIEEVLRSGVVANYHTGNPKWCVPLKAQATAKPGQIVIFDKKRTFLDRVLQEIP